MHPDHDCENCGLLHTRWSIMQADYERRLLIMPEALVLFDDAVKLFTDRDLAVVDEVITTLYMHYLADERAEL